MKGAKSKIVNGVFNANVIGWALAGSILLVGLSYAQKVAAGFNPYLLKAYIIPTLFGCLAGFVVGVYTHKLKHTARRLQESEEKYRSMMEAMVDAVYICSSDFRIEYANPVMIEKVGPEAVGEKCYAVLHELSEQCPWCCHHEVMAGNNTTIEVVSPKDRKSYLVSSSPLRLADGAVSKLSVIRDVTDLRNMEKQIQQARKMEAIGALAGGIAHDFNNILSAMLGYAELLKMSLAEGSDEHGYAGCIERAGGRAKDLVHQILTFSRRTKHETEPVELGLIVEEAAKLLRSTLPATIEIQRRIQKTSLVLANPSQIHQVLMNLGTNAGHAMRETGGVLAFELEPIELTDKLTNERMELNPGSYIRLSVSDTGHGIPPDIIDRIFDPFFTTKEPGEGTGMGLSVTHGIVKSFGGAIYVYSEEGQGTVFLIYLPVAEIPGAPRVRKDDEIPKGNERILFVDDELMLTQLGTARLEKLGYRVVARCDSLEALEVFKAKPADFDLVITDMTMPKMTGSELARKIRQLRPDIPIIMCTGFNSTIYSEDRPPSDVDAVLMKPVIIGELARMIRKALDK